MGKSYEYSIEQIIELSENDSSNLKTPKTNLFKVKSDTWVRIKLKTTENRQSNYLLEVGEPSIRHIHFYSVKNRKVQEHLQSGVGVTFEKRKELYRNHVFPINIPDSSVHTYYMYISTNGNRSIASLSFYTEDDYQKKNMLQTLEVGIGMGLLLLVCLVSGVLFVVFKKKIYLLYSSHLLFVILFILSRSGVGFRYLWPDYPEWNLIFMRTGLYGLIIFVSLFTIYFLRVRTFSKVLTYLLFVDVLLHTIFLVAIFLRIDPMDLPKATFSSFLHSILLIVVGIAAIRRNLKQASIYTVGIILFSIVGIIQILALYGVAPLNFSKLIALRYGWYLEVFFLSLAVAFRFKSVLFENEQLLVKNKLAELQLSRAKGAINEVEQKIETRNRKLLSSNIELTKRMEELTIIKNEVNDTELRKKLERLIENQDSEHTSSNWEAFMSIFEQIHPSFFHRIMQEYPQLTQNDLRYAAYVKMGFSSKEIASILNVQVDSLKNTRYRIRKKAGLDSSIKVNDFLMKY
ncbi:MAG: hypothetical protein NXI20_18530 [bacterium]|nr:hypothetical protein [bacterium]